jgi:hypothetical protein
MATLYRWTPHLYKKKICTSNSVSPLSIYLSVYGYYPHMHENTSSDADQAWVGPAAHPHLAICCVSSPPPSSPDTSVRRSGGGRGGDRGLVFYHLSTPVVSSRLPGVPAYSRHLVKVVQDVRARIFKRLGAQEPIPRNEFRQPM